MTGPWLSRAALAALVLLAAEVAAARPVVAQDAPTPAQVSAEEFAGLDWLAGRWVGSGGGYDAFYEAYRFLNDSTIEQTTYPDGSFGEAEGRSTMELRDGGILKLRNGEVESVITRLAGDTIRFERVPARPFGYSWIRVSDDEWTAILERPGGADPVVYTLRRIP